MQEVRTRMEIIIVVEKNPTAQLNLFLLAISSVNIQNLAIS